MPDYSTCIIYKICCRDVNIPEIYVGSTCNFINRRHAHKSNCHNENVKNYSLKVYQFIRENGGWANWSMIMVEERSVETKLQKGKLEREWIEKLKASLNSQIPSRTDAEYSKEHYQLNKDKIQEKNKEKFDCECGGKFTYVNKLRHSKTKRHTNFI